AVRRVAARTSPDARVFAVDSVGELLAEPESPVVDSSIYDGSGPARERRIGSHGFERGWSFVAGIPIPPSGLWGQTTRWRPKLTSSKKTGCCSASIVRSGCWPRWHRFLG